MAQLIKCILFCFQENKTKQNKQKQNIENKTKKQNKAEPKKKKKKQPMFDLSVNKIMLLFV